MLMVFFAGGSFFDWFPLRGLTSDNFAQLSWWEKIVDYFWHLALPLTAMVLSAFATTTLLTKNSFLDEIRKQYVVTARAKGLSERQVLYGHVFRNAMLIIIAGFPGAFISAFFTGSLLIENIFSLDGLGLLGFRSVIDRDYPVVFANLYIFSLIGLFVSLISDLHLHLDRPAHRLRAEGRHDGGRRHCAPARTEAATAFAAQPAALARISRRTGAATGRCGYSSRCSSCRCLPSSIANDRPMLASYKGETAVSRCWSTIRRRSSAASTPSPTIAIRSSRTRSRPMAG